ncbi:hypothetical protein HYC85_001091 [Camellia sinensis]|uniref:RRM domain-containing protein n=1 Tax=Camellia sinensis TaxID=4442 RepID=A0A7J7I4E1_CAMSI|nr:hypothetical protein HYC85_001091 [Camellia sinensis]
MNGNHFCLNEKRAHDLKKYREFAKPAREQKVTLKRRSKILDNKTKEMPSVFAEQIIESTVKTVYVEGLTDAGNKEKVKEICTQYGEVVEVQLPQSLGSKRKYFWLYYFYFSRKCPSLCGGD